MTYANFYVVHHLMFALVFVTAHTLDDMNRQGQARKLIEIDIFVKSRKMLRGWTICANEKNSR